MSTPLERRLGIPIDCAVDEALTVAAETTLSSRARYGRLAIIAALRADGYLGKAERGRDEGSR